MTVKEAKTRTAASQKAFNAFKTGEMAETQKGRLSKLDTDIERRR
jgi:hypothetical protein